ncbi:MAG: hypothetical protein JST55_14715 [Bacteroidetes bacterium]|nr:hypothetical protein [Bacteroidota bacterium]
MEKIKLLLILISLFSISSVSYAQYYQSTMIEYAPLFIIKNSVNKEIRDADAEVLKTNKVKEVLVKNDAGKYTHKMLVNNFGYIEDYMLFDPVDERLTAQWRFGYDANTNLTAVTRKEGRIRMSYIFTYEKNLLASIHIDSSGIESQYDFAYTSDNKITKATLLDLVKDTVAEKYFFGYDSYGRLIKVNDEKKSDLLCDISYTDNSINIFIKDEYSFIYELKNKRISEELYSLLGLGPSNYSVVIKYFYDENGLITEVQKTMDNIYTSEKYEYVFYTP